MYRREGGGGLSAEHMAIDIYMYIGGGGILKLPAEQMVTVQLIHVQ